jgi:hypothetical protein
MTGMLLISGVPGGGLASAGAVGLTVNHNEILGCRPQALCAWGCFLGFVEFFFCLLWKAGS